MEKEIDSIEENISAQVQEIQIVSNGEKFESEPSQTLNSNSNGNVYDTDSPFYSEAKKYWSNIPATVDGMLGGYGTISFRDIRGSSAFLKEIFKMKPTVGRQTAIDCGAGIGRVTKFLLAPFFRTVDMVEQDENFANSARKFLGPNTQQLGTIYNVGLQNFTPESGKYDVIWCQWVLSHLTDADLKKFFERAALGLAKNGVIIIKENVTSSGHMEADLQDSSITRPLSRFYEIINASNLRTIKSVKQADLPKGLFPIYMIAMRPVKLLATS